MTSTAHKFNNINKQIPETQAPQSLKQNQKLKKIYKKKKSIDFWNTHFPKCKNDELKSQKNTHTHKMKPNIQVNILSLGLRERERERLTGSHWNLWDLGDQKKNIEMGLGFKVQTNKSYRKSQKPNCVVWNAER